MSVDRRARVAGLVLTCVLGWSGSASGSGFGDAALEAAVRQALGVASGELDAGHLAELTELLAADRGIRSLQGMEQLTSLESLDLSGNEVADLAPLAGLTRLRLLSLEDNRVTDLSPLAGLAHLEVLIASHNEVTDLAALLGLPALGSVEILGCPLSAAARATQVPALEQRGVEVLYDAAPDEGGGAQTGPWTYAGPPRTTVTEQAAVPICAPGQPDALYAFVGAALWRSRDGGATWQPTAWSATLESVHVLVDALDPDLVYADAPARSRDGGLTWETLEVDGHLVAADPVVSGRVWAYRHTGTALYLLRSDDQGSSWRERRVEVTTPDSSVFDVRLRIQPRDSRRLFFEVRTWVDLDLAVADLLTSADAGDTWEHLEVPRGLKDVALDPGQPGHVYALAGDQVQHSTDGGRTWQPVGRLPVVSVKYLAVHPADRQWLFAWTDRAYQSQDGGRTWQLLSASAFGVVPHPVDPLRVWVLGAHTLETRDRGATWQELTVQVEEAQPALSLALAPGGPWLMGSSRQGVRGDVPELYASGDRGRAWEAVVSQLPAGLSGVFCTLLVDPRDPLLLLAHADPYGRRPLRSADGGQSWTEGQIPWNTLGPWRRVVRGTPLLARGGAQGEVLFAVVPATAQLFRSRDLGATWQAVRDSVTALAAEPGEDGALYAGWWEAEEVWRSADGGDTWQSLGPVAAGEHVCTLAVDPGERGRLYAATDKGLYTSLGARSWTRLLALEPAPPAARYLAELRFAPAEPRVLCLFGGPDLRRSADGGRTWRSLGQDLSPSPWFYDVALDPQDAGTLYAATPAGLYRWSEPGAVSAVTDAGPQALPPTRLAPPYPNPGNGAVTLRLELQRAAHVEVALYDLLGQRVVLLVDGERAAGMHGIRWDGRDGSGRPAASGVYLCRLLLDGAPAGTQRLVLAR